MRAEVPCGAVEGEAICLLPEDHDGPHEFTPFDSAAMYSSGEVTFRNVHVVFIEGRHEGIRFRPGEFSGNVTYEKQFTKKPEAD